jgi:hypothetical protein
LFKVITLPFFFDNKTKETLLVNDRLGYLPLYYYDGNDYFLFASKIESLLASKLIPDIFFDEVTMAEHLFFHYPLSDHTYIKNIFTLPDASNLCIKDEKLIIDRYWDIEELFGIHSLGGKDSIEIIDNALRYAKTEIVITLKNKKLTFYNDGEPISQKFIDQHFRPYEKGQKGQFGLGLSIVQKTCEHFNLMLKVQNIKDGVMFTIEPL